MNLIFMPVGGRSYSASNLEFVAIALGVHLFFFLLTVIGLVQNLVTKSDKFEMNIFLTLGVLGTIGWLMVDLLVVCILVAMKLMIG